MQLSIDEIAGFLPNEIKVRFYSEVIDCIYNGDWCRKHNLPNLDPNIEEVKEILFREKYTDKINFLSVKDSFIKESQFRRISESDFPVITTPSVEELRLR